VPVAPSTPAPARASAGLLRQWDANGDGRIDEAEAELARSKMRRERAEMWQQSQTFEPQLPTDANAGLGDAPIDLVFPEPPARVKKEEEADGDRKGFGTKPRSSASNPREPPPRKDLNAGRLPAGLPAARGLPAGTPPAGWAGSNAAAPPQRGAANRPPLAPRAVAPRVSRPPTVPSRPRVSAEEIGGP
jgi:hypothetical protein